MCVSLIADGAVIIHEGMAKSNPAAIATVLARAPATKRIVFDTGRMADKHLNLP
jgi:hypothetical protein